MFERSGCALKKLVDHSQGRASGALQAGSHAGSIVDPVRICMIVARIPVGDDPHEVVASADGKTAYVSNYGFGAFHTLAVIDLVGQKQAQIHRSGRAARAAWAGFQAGQGVVYGRGGEGHRQLRSGHGQDRLDHGNGAEPDAHGLCLSRWEADSDHQRERGDGDHSWTRPKAAGGPPPGMPPGMGQGMGRRAWGGPPPGMPPGANAGTAGRGLAADPIQPPPTTSSPS
jgi:hypothetical protein